MEKTNIAILNSTRSPEIANIFEDESVVVMGQFVNTCDACLKLKEIFHKVDVIVMNFNQINDLLIVNKFKKDCKLNPHLIILSNLLDEELVLKCFELGAVNLINNEKQHRDALSAIHEASKGKSMIHSSVAKTIRNSIQLRSLTSCERKIYNLKLKGLTNAEIAESLYSSPYTIRNHIKSIRKKLKYIIN